MTIGNNLIYSNAALSARTKRSERELGRRDYERPRPYNNDPPDLYNSPKRRREERYRPYQELYQPPTTDDPAWPQPSNLKPHRTPKQRRESERYKAPSKPPTSDNPSSKPPSASDHSSKEKGPLQRNQMNRLSFYGSWRR